jgi:hypothetical protein
MQFKLLVKQQYSLREKSADFHLVFARLVASNHFPGCPATGDCRTDFFALFNCH